MPLYGQSSGSPRRFMQTGWGHVFACLLWIVVIHLLWGMEGLLPRLRACRKGTIGSL
jgi:hypothetical protein